MNTSGEVRAHFLRHWPDLLPPVLGTSVRVGVAEWDSSVVQMDLLGHSGAVRHLLCVSVASGEPRHVREALPRLRTLGSAKGVAAVLLAPHLGVAGIRICREAGLGYLDCCGNGYLRFNQVFVQIAGNRNRFTARKQVRTLFHDKATIPLRVLLKSPGQWMTTRQIAKDGGLSLGWVSQILQQMQTDGYVERKRGGGSRLVQPQRLLADWLKHYAFDSNEVYPFRMRDTDPAKLLQRLRTVDGEMSDRYALTLDAALHALHLGSPQRRLPFPVHVYLPELNEQPEHTLESWTNMLSLRPAGHDANCFLVKPTYRHGALFDAQVHGGLRAVSDLQLYMDMTHAPGVTKKATRSVSERLPFEIPH